MNVIKIYQPRWRSREVLVAAFNVQSGRNIIRIDAARADGSKFYAHDFAMDSSKIKTYPTEQLIAKSSGKPYTVYVVPLDDLEVYEDPNTKTVLYSGCKKHPNAIPLHHGGCTFCIEDEEIANAKG